MGQVIGFNIAKNSPPCPSSSLDLSTDCSPLRAYLLRVEPYLCATVFSGVYLLLWHGLVHIHSCFEVHLLQRGLTHSHSPFRSVPTPTWPYPWLQSLQGCIICSAVGLSMATCFEVLQHDLMHSHCRFKVYLLQYGLIHHHRCFEVYLLQHELILGPQSLQRYTCCSTDITTATDASRCTCSGMELSTATDDSGCPAPAWTHPQVTVPLTQVHTGVPACPVQQHRNSSDTLTICQPGTSSLLLSEYSQAQQSKMISSTAGSKSKKQPLTSTRLTYSKASKTHGKHRSLPINN